ncbi:hypothetical protein BJX64DRAFT_284016 [Aspergillus heterothallicus]
MANNLSQTLSARCFLPTNQDCVAKSHKGKEAADGAKKRGRPRMAPMAGDTTRMDRRAQIRYAQRTYRHKKELRHRSMELRVAELESTLSRVSDSLSEFFDMAIDSDLHVTHPHLFTHLRDTVTQLKRATREGDEETPSRELILPVIFSANVSSTPENTGPFGYIVNSVQDSDGRRRVPITNIDNDNKKQPFQHQIPNSQSQIENPLPGTSQQTYSFTEPTLIRILQRYCLEYSYRVFSDPRSDPRDFYRVFRLVPCVKYREKMGKYLLCLVRSDAGQRLDIPALPFYCIGGAGTHYPRFEGGKRMYHEKMRLPRRILGNFASLVSGGAEGVDREVLLRLAGLDGTWLDCWDVVGFLEEKGVLGGSGDAVALSFDVEGFLKGEWLAQVDDSCLPSSALVRNMVILGRSPGFRLRDVEAALAAALRVDSR